MERYEKAAMLVACAIVFAGCADEAVPKPEGSDVITRSEIIDCPYGDDQLARVDPEKSLVIRDLSVVNDPCRTTLQPDPALNCRVSSVGEWTFWHLMDELSGPRDTSDFVLEWLESFADGGEVNGFQLRPREMVRELVIDPWRDASECVEGEACQLDPNHAPFRLLAIVNRMDLFGGFAEDGEMVMGPYGPIPSGSMGEGRFVFGFLDENRDQLEATVIFEFAQPPTPWAEMMGEFMGPEGMVSAQADEWIYLSRYNEFDDRYKRQLESLTDTFARREHLNQIRTNEFAFVRTGGANWFQDDLWSLREFELDLEANALFNRPVAQTPDSSHNDYVFAAPNEGLNPLLLMLFPWLGESTGLLSTYLADHADEVLAGSHVIPLTVNGQPFRAAEGTSGGRNQQNEIFWTPASFGGEPFIGRLGDVNQEQSDVRRLFAFNTCGGCHYRETDTRNFHIAPRRADQPADLSTFLSARLERLPEPPGFNRLITSEYDEPLRRQCEMVHFYRGNASPLSQGTGRVH